ncbi:MAG: four helix bundle protein [Pirellulales bacterium]|nr:four helix bundle protein [Pirellulales bacterium]
MARELPEIRTFRDLVVWQKSMAMVKDMYRVTSAFPSDEKFGLTSQMRRCAVSIPSNIAEGYGRQSTTDYVRFLRIAVGSLYELQTQVEIAAMLSYVPQGEQVNIQDRLQEIERMLTSLVRKVGKSRD